MPLSPPLKADLHFRNNLFSQKNAQTSLRAAPCEVILYGLQELPGVDEVASKQSSGFTAEAPEPLEPGGSHPTRSAFGGPDQKIRRRSRGKSVAGSNIRAMAIKPDFRFWGANAEDEMSCTMSLDPLRKFAGVMLI